MLDSTIFLRIMHINYHFGIFQIKMIILKILFY